MVLATSWVLRMSGHYVSGPWIGEIVMCQLSGTGSDGVAPTGYSGIDVPLVGCDISPSTDVGTTTHFNVIYGFVGSGAGPFPKTDQDTMAEAVYTFLDGLKAYVTTSFAWDKVELLAKSNANQTLYSSSIYTNITPLVGGGATSYHPPQTAVAFSLDSGGRNARNRNRFYFPYTSGSIATDGLVPSATRTSFANAVKTLVNALTFTHATSGSFAAIVSKKWETFDRIKYVKIGDEFDTASKRRNKRPETYTVLAV